MGEVVMFALKALQALPSILAAGSDALAHIRATQTAVAAMQAQGRGPSEQEWAAQDDTINGLMGQLKD